MWTVIKACLSELRRLSQRVATLANVVGTLMLLGLVGIVNYDVVARGLFNAPFMGAVEVVKFAMVLIVFLQLPDVVRVNRLTRSDGFLLLLDHRAPRLSKFLRRSIDTVAAVFMALIAIAIYPEFLNMLETGRYFGVPGIFTAPWWPIKLAILFSATLCMAIFTIKVLMPDSEGAAAKAPHGARDSA